MKKFFIAIALIFAFASFNPSGAYAQENTPVFEVLTPKEGQTIYGQKIPILFNVENFELADGSSAPSPTQGHILLWLDQDTPTAENATRVVEDTFIYSDVNYGQHTLKAELVTNDGKSLTPQKTATVTFTTEAVAQTETPTITSGFDKTTAIVILAVVALVILAAWWYTKDEEDLMEENSTKPKAKTAKKSQKTKTNKRKTKK